VVFFSLNASAHCELLCIQKKTLNNRVQGRLRSSG
jgi:hypothetical protein